MVYLRLFAQKYKFIWLFCLALALIGIQSVNVHLDVYDHQHSFAEHQTATHTEHELTHVCIAACDNSHDHESFTELDITPDGVVKKLSLGSLLLALLISTIVIIFAQRSCDRIAWHSDIEPLPRWQSALYPPLRGPPR